MFKGSKLGRQYTAKIRDALGASAESVAFSQSKTDRGTADGKNNFRTNKTKRRSIKEDTQSTWVLSDGLPYLRTSEAAKLSNLDAKNTWGEDFKYKYVKGGLIVNGVHSFRVCKHPIRNATRPQRFQKPALSSSIFYNNCKEIFDSYDINVDKCVIVAGSWTTNKHTLQQQLIPENNTEFCSLPSAKVQKKLHNAVRIVLRKLKIETLAKCEKGDMLFSHYNKETYPGFIYDQYGLKNKKKDCLEEALELAEVRWDRIAKGNFSRNDIFPSLYTIGARNKRDFTYEEQETAASRVVHMPEFHTELTSGPWTDQITELFKEKRSGPVYIGNSFLDYERLQRSFSDAKTVFEGDWKRFDASLYINIIISAVSILRCFYDLDDREVDNHFRAIFDCVGIKDYYIPGGDVIRAFNGLPSGVKSTNLIGTIINMIALAFCTAQINAAKMNFVVGGDDFDIACFKKDLHIKRFINEFTKRASILGMRVKFLVNKSTSGLNTSLLPCFYKYVVVDDSPAIPTENALERAFMPWNKSYSSDSDVLDFLNDVMPSLGQPRTHLIMYYLYYKYIFEKVFKRKKNLSEIISYHKVIYDSMMLRKEQLYRNSNGMDFTIPLVGIAANQASSSKIKLISDILNLASM